MVGTFDLGLDPSDHFLAHTLVATDCVWLLGLRKKLQKHFILSLKVENGALKVVSVNVPLERFPTSIAAVAHRKHGTRKKNC